MAKKVTYKSAAIAVLELADKPMHRKEILRLAMEEHGLVHNTEEPIKAMTDVLLNKKNKDVFKWEYTAHFSLVDKSSTISDELGDTQDSINKGFERINEKIKGIGSNTMEDVSIAKRVGQNYFREGLLKYWKNRCPLTDISNPSLLVASHIIPWSRSYEIRLDLYNGILLSPLWDKAFDKGLLTFDTTGKPKFSSKLTEHEVSCLFWNNKTIQFDDRHIEKIKWHQENVFDK